MPSFTGFAQDEEALVRQAYTEAVLCIQNGVKGYKAGGNTYEADLEKYFGSTSATQKKKIKGVIKAMNMATDAGTYNFQRVKGGSGFFGKNYGVVAKGRVYGVGRQALVWEGDDGTKGKYRDLLLKNCTTAPDPITVFDSFFGLQMRNMDSENMVASLLHEISHHAANTADETFASIELYGWPGIKMAVLYGVADNNAENYGFFLAGLRNFN